LKSLNLSFCHISREGVERLNSLTTLRHLNFSFSNIRDEDLEHLNLEELEHLNLSGSSITDEGLKNLKKTYYLKHLNISHCSNITSESVRRLSNKMYFGRLEKLDLSYCPQITDNIADSMPFLFRYLKVLDLSHCPKITEEGLNNIKKEIERPFYKGAALNKVTLYRNEKITNDNLVPLQNSKEFKDVTLYRNEKITDDDLAYLQNLEKLDSSDTIDAYLNFADVSEKHAKLVAENVKKFARLEYINPVNIDDEFLSKICKYFPNLEVLNLFGSRITNKGLKIIGENFKKLKDLNLSSAKKITDDGIFYLSQLKELKNLNLSEIFGKNITDTSLEYLKNLNLKKIILENCYTTNNSLKYLEGYKDLEELNLKNNYKVTDDGLFYLRNLKNLEILTLTGSFMEDADENMYFLRNLTNLKELKIAGIGVAHKVASYLENLKNLTHLEICVEDESIYHLRNLTQLKVLFIHNCLVTDKGVDYLSGLINLRALHLYGSSMTYKGLEKLKNLKKLQYLEITSFEKIGSKGVKIIAENFKDLRELHMGWLDRGQREDIEYSSENLDEDFTNEDIKIIVANLKNLEGFIVSDYDSLTNEGLRPLNDLKNLSWVSFTECEQITNELRQILEKSKNHFYIHNKSKFH
jgi:hypothetical protein